jgi:hypothetical protein
MYLKGSAPDQKLSRQFSLNARRFELNEKIEEVNESEEITMKMQSMNLAREIQKKKANDEE